MLLLSNSAQTTPVAVLGDGGGKEAPEMGSPPLHSPLSEPHPHHPPFLSHPTVLASTYGP